MDEYDGGNDFQNLKYEEYKKRINKKETKGMEVSMITIERHDIKKLEDYIKNIERYRRELKVREYELLENHEPENVGAGKSNIPGNPIERDQLRS